MPNKPPAICPVTVAIVAPAVPNAGNPDNQKSILDQGLDLQWMLFQELQGTALIFQWQSITCQTPTASSDPNENSIQIRI